MKHTYLKFSKQKLVAFSVVGAFMFFAVASTEEQAATAPPSSERVSVGESAQSGSVEFSVISVKTITSIGDPEMFGAKASEGGVYVVIDYTLENISKKPLGSFSQPSVELISNDGTAYDEDINASSSYATESELDEKILSDLNPGIKVKGAAVFEVSKELFDPSTWSFKVTTDDGVIWFNLN
jgi:hypothetical protein